MAEPNTSIRTKWYGNLRVKCFIIGYMHMIASIVDIACHVLVVAIASNGFQCDVDEDSLANIDWPWLEPFFLAINMGTHGFYPFPLILRSRNNVFLDYMPSIYHPRCYPGMLHIYMIDILNFMINVIWLKFVKAYVTGLHQKNIDPMRMFFGLCFVKLILQVLYFSYQPAFRSASTVEAYWLVKVMDMVLGTIFLLIIHAYIKELRREKAPQADLPPPYVECLVSSQAQQKEKKEDKKETEVTIPEEKKTGENTVEALERV